MNSPGACEGVVLYWGRGFRAEPAEYGFIALHGDSEEIHYFDLTHMADGSLPPAAGALVTCAIASESAPGADLSQLKRLKVSAGEPSHPPRSWSATIAVITASCDSGGTLRCLNGQSARFTREATVGGCPAPEAFVRCRLLPPGTQGGSSRAFDVVAIDFTNPIEQARLRSYLAMTETPFSSPPFASTDLVPDATVSQSLTEGSDSLVGLATVGPQQPHASEQTPPVNRRDVSQPTPSLRRRRGSRRLEENSPPWISTDIAFDRGLGELHLPGKRIIKVPLRYRAVLRAMTAKTPDNPKLRASFLTYQEVATKFEEGLRDAEEERVSKGKLPRKGKARQVMDRRRDNQSGDRGRPARFVAQEFVRCFFKWLRRRKIKPSSVIECDYNAEAYGLAFGWSRHSVAKNDGEVTMQLSGRAAKSGLDPDAEGGRESDPENENEADELE